MTELQQHEQWKKQLEVDPVKAIKAKLSQDAQLSSEVERIDEVKLTVALTLQPPSMVAHRNRSESLVYDILLKTPEKRPTSNKYDILVHLWRRL